MGRGAGNKEEAERGIRDGRLKREQSRIESSFE